MRTVTVIRRKSASRKKSARRRSAAKRTGRVSRKLSALRRTKMSGLRGGMRFFVQGLQGTSYALELEPSALVGEIKPLLEELEGIPADEQVLSFGGAPLDDSRSLADSGLGEDVTLSMAHSPSFVMPVDKDGRPDFGPKIRGSLAAWRAANPDALVANIEMRTDLNDADFVHLRKIRALNMSSCYQDRVTDAAFKHLEGIHTLNMSYCDQRTITDAAFAHLRGIHTLDMSECSQRTITDAAFEHLRGIHTLNMDNCTQRTITNAAFEHMRGIHTLTMSGCDQETITNRALQYLRGVKNLNIAYCQQFTCIGIKLLTNNYQKPKTLEYINFSYCVLLERGDCIERLTTYMGEGNYKNSLPSL